LSVNDTTSNTDDATSIKDLFENGGIDESFGGNAADSSFDGNASDDLADDYLYDGEEIESKSSLEKTIITTILSVGVISGVGFVGYKFSKKNVSSDNCDSNNQDNE
jgi:hypothetical protein